MPPSDRRILWPARATGAGEPFVGANRRMLGVAQLFQREPVSSPRRPPRKEGENHMGHTEAPAWWADVQHLRDVYERTDEARRRADSRRARRATAPSVERRSPTARCAVRVATASQGTRSRPPHDEVRAHAGAGGAARRATVAPAAPRRRAPHRPARRAASRPDPAPPHDRDPSRRDRRRRPRRSRATRESVASPSSPAPPRRSAAPAIERVGAAARTAHRHVGAAHGRSLLILRRRRHRRRAVRSSLHHARPAAPRHAQPRRCCRPAPATPHRHRQI